MKYAPLVLVSLALLAMTSARARAGPTPDTTATPIPPATITASPTPSPTRTATPSPTVTPTSTATPLPPAIAITAAHKVRRCLSYKGIMESWIALEPPEYVEIGLDDIPVLLGICAAESGGRMDLVSPAGAIGIMQVIPKPWTGSAFMLRNVPRANIYWGMWIYDRALAKYEDVRTALAMYNCSEEKVYTDMCGPKGGYNYSDEILEFWIPLFEIELEAQDGTIP